MGIQGNLGGWLDRWPLYAFVTFRVPLWVKLPMVKIMKFSDGHSELRLG